MSRKTAPEYSGYTLDIHTERGFTQLENLTLVQLSAACLNAMYALPNQGWHCGWPAVGTPFPWRGRNLLQPSALAPTFNLVARSGRGRLLDAAVLLKHQERLENEKRARRWRRRRLDGWNGEGPVPGTGSRSRYRGCYRRPHTQAERRTAVWLVEDGEPRIRAQRRANYLPTRWDDLYRRTERNWKSQHKGRKAWDKG